MKHNKESVESIVQAISARIRALEEELKHWRRVLAQCEAMPAPQRPRRGRPGDAPVDLAG
jgi:hypothetical protein